MLVNTKNYSRHVEMRGDVETLRLQVIRNLNCDKTMRTSSQPIARANLNARPPRFATCTGAMYSLRNSGNRQLFPGGRAGDLEVRAFCPTSPSLGNGIDVQVRRVKNGRVVRDTLTGKALDWRSILGGQNSFLCRNYFDPAATPPQCDVSNGQVMTGITPGGTPICGQLENALTTQVLEAAIPRILPRLALSPATNTVHCKVKPSGQCLKTVKAQICTLANVEANDHDTRFSCNIGSSGGTCRGGKRASGIDCQVFGGSGKWQLMASGRALKGSSGICSMTCFNFSLK